MGYGRQQFGHVRHTCGYGQSNRQNRRELATYADEYSAGIRPNMCIGMAPGCIYVGISRTIPSRMCGICHRYLPVRGGFVRCCQGQGVEK